MSTNLPLAGAEGTIRQPLPGFARQALAAGPRRAGSPNKAQWPRGCCSSVPTKYWLGKSSPVRQALQPSIHHQVPRGLRSCRSWQVEYSRLTARLQRSYSSGSAGRIGVGKVRAGSTARNHYLSLSAQSLPRFTWTLGSLCVAANDGGVWRTRRRRLRYASAPSDSACERLFLFLGQEGDELVLERLQVWVGAAVYFTPGGVESRAFAL